MNAIDLAARRIEAAPSSDRVTKTLRHLGAPTLWVEMSPDRNTGIHNITPALVQEFSDALESLKCDIGLRYAVLKSTDPEYFSVGGDLPFMRGCIKEGDFDTLRAYSMRCYDLIHAFHAEVADDMTTVALIQGRALGGGFELALGADFIIAEEHSTFAFPEIMFGLFPCSGAMGLLSARVSPKQAEKMMTDGRIYTANELHAMGIVDMVCATGRGELEVEKFVEMHAKRRNARLRVQASRRRISGLERAEGELIVDEWVALAAQLSKEELRTLDMLIMMQRGSSEQKREKAAA